MSFRKISNDDTLIFDGGFGAGGSLNLLLRLVKSTERDSLGGMVGQGRRLVLPFVKMAAEIGFCVCSRTSTSIGTDATSSNIGISPGKGSSCVGISELHGGRGSSLCVSTAGDTSGVRGGERACRFLRGGCRCTTTVAGHFSMTGAETDSIGSETTFSTTEVSTSESSINSFAFAFPFHLRGCCTGRETEATSGVGAILGFVLRFMGVVSRGSADFEVVDRNWRRSFSLPRVCRDGPATEMVLSMRSNFDLY